ncbi:response regulator transcription factor [Sphingosinicella rhizophila]|uniref:Response regulator transcription factor n=1 Tax=Sphingosinicella rhizophila TaxID=3050082 RepID=A0ABU3Q676_9SPHN|nr:response regulator transcription factor [Sphingosinicella sp. GR2756]MDT9598912.1 response regulator transcription factor [Sphingosinicella sp. GR2756]
MSSLPPLLLVDDEPTLRRTLEAILEFGGFESDAVENAAEALERLRSKAYSGILLDLGLPDVDGAELIRTIRAESDIPILVVSGRATDNVSALDLGADDFIAKPFLPDELLARVRAVLRRNNPGAMPPMSAPTPTEVEEEAEEAGVEETYLREGTLEAKLFSFLLERSDELVPTEDLLDALWGERTDQAQNHLRVLVAKLRIRLKAEGQKLLILNEWGKGYRMTGATDRIRK